MHVESSTPSPSGWRRLAQCSIYVLMSTLRELRDYGASVLVFCTTMGNPPCSNSWAPSMDQLVQYYGLEFDVHARRGEFLGRMICEKCGQRNVQTIWMPPPRIEGEKDGTGAAHVQIEWNTALRKRIHEEGEAARIAIQHQVQFIHDNRKRNREEAKVRKAIESGRDLIGPPSPFEKPRPKLTR